jgi:hypothetical protein
VRIAALTAALVAALGARLGAALGAALRAALGASTFGATATEAAAPEPSADAALLPEEVVPETAPSTLAIGLTWLVEACATTMTGAAAAAVAEATTLTAVHVYVRGALAALGAAMVTRAMPTAGALAVATVSTVITLGCEGRAVASAC